MRDLHGGFLIRRSLTSMFVDLSPDGRQLRPLVAGVVGGPAMVFLSIPTMSRLPVMLRIFAPLTPLTDMIAFLPFQNEASSKTFSRSSSWKSQFEHPAKSSVHVGSTRRDDDDTPGTTGPGSCFNGRKGVGRRTSAVLKLHTARSVRGLSFRSRVLR